MALELRIEKEEMAPEVLQGVRQGETSWGTLCLRKVLMTQLRLIY